MGRSAKITDNVRHFSDIWRGRVFGAYEEALKAKPNDEPALLSLGVAAEASGDLAKAEQAYMGASNFAEGGDEAAEAKEALGNLYGRCGRYKDALDAFSDSNEMAFDDYYPEENMAYGQKTRTC